MNAPTFKRVTDGKVKISAPAYFRISRFQQDTLSKAEAGGVLLGRLILACSDVVVDDVTEPMPGDVRSRYRFHRSRAGHQAAISAAWERSLGTSTYLGEWHTHPESQPTPSSIDLDNWRKALKNVFDGESLFFIIVGTNVVRVWEALRGTRQDPVLIGESPVLPLQPEP